MGGDRRDPLAEDGGRVTDRAGDHRAAAAAAGAGAERRERGVALDRVDVEMSTPSASAVSWIAVVSRLLPAEPPARYTLTAPEGSIRIVAPSLPWSAMPLAVGST